MRENGGTWTVRYSDGSELGQYDRDHPACGESGEVPYRAIEWARVNSVYFESQHARTKLTFNPPPDDFAVALRSRHFASLKDTSTMAFMVLTYPKDKTPQDAVDVLYWLADGTTHACHLFDCPAVRQYAIGVLHGNPVPLALEHNAKDIVIDGALAN